uniref:Uncharacterized protein n=1 Tax=Chaetoceros debilis TaxID=122233 RepID=A0A6S8X503_9STRA|mmetsp:Transcript_5331/g.7902  ORF Transcript_5331/g.7902 Transcript_5331/m.7902 type:complete len:974 (+) Transcript_5331:53-2974(+)|eukprot:CAMPEP_0194081880 /NCGR_PEP_ID=MMETSP0149-20130528/7535_1 /TAXON_ID=122233 /ORGANISM="Chaetoceros debilis, Strain MM31A-1" /LENGTH=973 /DNA_ID=CAMNT_0038763895 /DNA_START=63 /DNA_END=2984 /DNA_ORIENTATION=+
MRVYAEDTPKPASDNIRVFTLDPKEFEERDGARKSSRNPRNIKVSTLDKSNHDVKPRTAERERKIRNDAAQCKVKVKKVRTQTLEEENQYVIKGKNQSVVLEFRRKLDSMKVARQKSTERKSKRFKSKSKQVGSSKRLGNAIGRDEMKRRARGQPDFDPEFRDEDDDDDDDKDGEMDENEGDENEEEDNGAANGDTDTNWFKFDSLNERDYFNFLKSVKCSAYSIRNFPNLDINCNSGDIDKEETRDDNILEDLGNDLREFKAKREEMEELEEEQMLMVEREEQHRRMQKELRRKEEEQIRLIQEEEDEIREENENTRREQEYLRKMQTEKDELRKIQREREEEMNVQKEREDALRIEQQRVELLEKGQLGGDEDDTYVSNERKNRKKKDQYRNTSERTSESKDESVIEEEPRKENSSWMDKIIAKFEVSSDAWCFDFCIEDTKQDNEETLAKRMRRYANNHEESPPTALYAAIGTQNWNIALRRLIDKPEEASTTVKNASTDGSTVFEFLPLHIACLSGAPLLLVTMLVQTYPDAVNCRAMNKLPIHMACEAQADHRIVFLLINALPQSLNEKDDEGNTPIEIASCGEINEERNKIIQMLTKRMENTVVRTPTALYSAIDSQNWNRAIMRLVEMPQESTTWVSYTKKEMEYRFLPLHAACLVGAPLLLISDLVDAYPDAARKKTTQGKLPLHIACEAHADERVVELLLETWPESLHIKDSRGNAPLEIAAAADFSPERTAILEVLEDKLDHNDTIVFAPTRLYYLIESKKWDKAVRYILEAPEEVSTWVGTCQKIADARLLPLHVACSLGAPLMLVAVLIQSYPESVKKTNNSGKLPIHLVCEKRSDHRVVALLLHTWPESYAVKDEKGNTPVQVALLSKESRERAKIVEALMEHEADSDQERYAMIDTELKAQAILNEHYDEDDSTLPDFVEAEQHPQPQKSKTKKSRWRKKNKHEKPTLWGNDDEMFAEY